MSTLKVSNVHFETTGTRRIDYVNNDGVIRMSADGIRLPSGNTVARPANEVGVIRYNTTNDKYEGYFPTGWDDIVGSQQVNIQIGPAFNTANDALAAAVALAIALG